MSELTFDDIAKYLCVPVRVGTESRLGFHKVIVQDTESSEVHVFWIVVVRKAEVKTRLKPPTAEFRKVHQMEKMFLQLQKVRRKQIFSKHL
mmetsp:Transcript_31925/g.75857  ORF Transcript_31925/g.75857 Transcript_31925/m.75857 type:complete len:91 (+) Transcript_31925:3-275(+)